MAAQGRVRPATCVMNTIHDRNSALQITQYIRNGMYDVHMVYRMPYTINISIIHIINTISLF